MQDICKIYTVYIGYMPYSLYKARVKENMECSGETYISCGIMTEQKKQPKMME